MLLKNEFATLLAKHPTAKSIAGYVDGAEVFQYRTSDNEHVPAAVILFDLFPDNPGLKVYSNLPEGHWLYTWKKGKLLNGSTTGKDVKGVNQITGRGQVRVVAGEGSDNAPFPDGGLYQAAETVYNRVWHPPLVPITEEGSTLNSGLLGRIKALRYYMLAAYALLGKGAEAAYNEGNYIAALMVDDTGKIVSYGYNSGQFHHGEVNMLLNHFRVNGNAKFPNKCLIFSTLTPCEQCSNYLEATRPGNSLIFIGQPDTGPAGSAGAKFGKFLDVLTDPIQTRVEGKGESPVKRYLNSALYERTLDGGGTIAKKIGEKCGDLLKESRMTLKHKVEKDRIIILIEQLIKAQVLEYLDTWLEGVPVASSRKDVMV